MKPGIRLRLKRKRYSKAAGKGVLRVQRRKRSAAVLTKGRGRASGYAQAYNKAFDQAYNEGFSTGFAKGLQDGQQA
jgi:flagellar biosynthesis/type III secretory pathway protein FliH